MYEVEPLIPTSRDEKVPAVDEKKSNTNAVGILEIFAFTDKWDVLLLILGLIGAVVTGLIFPVMTAIFGEVTSGFTSYQVQHEIAGCDSSCGSTTTGKCQSIDDSLKNHMSIVMWQMLTIGVIMWFGQYLMTLVLQTTAMRQVTRIRTKFLKAVLRQDITWYDTKTTSNFASKVTEDLDRIQDGIGEKMGMVVRFFVTFLGSFIYPFTQNWIISLVLCSILPVIALLVGKEFT